jgi:ribosome assembly protein 4
LFHLVVDRVLLDALGSLHQIWEIRTQKRLFELPGHADEVYAVDWAPDGDRVASGSKDRLLKIWSK